jgi:hypothetical protein
LEILRKRDGQALRKSQGVVEHMVKERASGSKLRASGDLAIRWRDEGSIIKKFAVISGAQVYTLRKWGREIEMQPMN